MAKDIRTYCSGPMLLATKRFTNHDLMKLCERLTTRFNEEFKASEFLFEPESISEGGIQMVKFPGHGGISHKFKTMRIWFEEYPWVDLDKWRVEAPIVMMTGRSREKINTYLKAFSGAPAWTCRELAIILEELGLYGFIPTKIPRKLSA